MTEEEIRETEGQDEADQKVRKRSREYMQARRQERFNAGLCVDCGKAAIVPGRKYCQPCLEKQRARFARWKAKATPEQREALRQRIRAWQDEHREEWLAKGLCLGCGKAEPAPQRKHCPACLEKYRNTARKNLARNRAILAQAKAIIAEANKKAGDRDGE